MFFILKLVLGVKKHRFDSMYSLFTKYLDRYIGKEAKKINRFNLNSL